MKIKNAVPTLSAGASWAWRHRTAVLGASVLVLVALNASTCDRAGRAEAQIEADRARAIQDARVRKANVPSVQLVPQPVVNEEAEAALRERPELIAQRDRLKAQVGKLRAVLAIRAQTDEVKAHGPERPNESPTAGAAPVVLLRDGDGLRFSLVGAGYEGDRGARALLLTIGANRSSDGAEIGRGPLSVPLSSIYEAPPSPAACLTAAERPWRLGASGGATGNGWVAGAVGTYRLNLWGWKPEGMATLNAGPGGVALIGGVLF